MMVLKYSDISLKCLNGYEITKSSQNVVFSDLCCEFTDYTADNLPKKYQEVEIVEQGPIDKTIFFGYINDIKFEEMRERDEEIFINISLLSPMAKSTLRTTVAVGTYDLCNLIENVILLPLIEDGFILKEMDILNRTITVNYLCETVEYCMNNLSNKFSFWWFINEKKEIYIKNIDSMFEKEPDYIYDDNHFISGLQYIKPTISSGNYANVINFKNVRIYDYSRLIFQNSNILESHNSLIDAQILSLKKDATINFNHPVDINKTNIIKSSQSREFTKNAYGIYVSGTYTDNTSFEFYIKYDSLNNEYVISDNVGFDGSSESNKEFLLIRDSFFSNLITGFKYNNENKTINNITSIKSDSVLVWNITKFYNDQGIANKRNVISKTGIVELTIDMNESWKTIPELQEIGASYVKKNELELDGEIEILTDQNIFEIGKTLYVNKMLFNSSYIITEIKEIDKNNETEYLITAKNANMLDSFVDIFRGENKQSSNNKFYKIHTLHYIEDEIKEVHEVIQ